MDPRYKSPDAVVIDVDADDEFRDLSLFTTVLKWMLIIGGLLAVFSLWSFWMQLDLLSRSFSPAEAHANDIRVRGLAGLSLLLTIVTLIVFARWIVLAHRNLPALGARYLDFTPGWAVGWFFVPVANIWKPFQAMRSLWQYSHSVHKPDLQDSTWVLGVWWTLWLISAVLGNFTMRNSIGTKTVADLTSTTQIGIANSFIDVFQYAIAVVLIARIWKAQAMQRDNPGEFEPQKGFAD